LIPRGRERFPAGEEFLDVLLRYFRRHRPEPEVRWAAKFGSITVIGAT
jgi:hypothetical protein